ncbi:hypothetical protein Taro_007183 [Colocasia esculenta]|uniref:Uncharacterized protein n=1 Tax=Colocasia esculenta TaxID=4460 RepID=A0A843TZI8_COLES|nr:hypothetical protein [Colocasia esculenta]
MESRIGFSLIRCDTGVSGRLDPARQTLDGTSTADAIFMFFQEMRRLERTRIKKLVSDWFSDGIAMELLMNRIHIPRRLSMFFKKRGDWNGRE